jgi:hypothetical protein
MKFNILLLVCFSCFISILAGPIHAKKQELPEVTTDGLHLVPDSKLAIVYAEPGADLSPYKRVKLLEAYVAFKKNWERNQRSSSAGTPISSRDIANIKDSLATEFHEVFKTALTDAGYELTEDTAEDVMIVRPAIINLDVNAPDKRAAGRSTTYVASAGEMTLYIELWDSVSGDIMAKAMDRRADNRHAGAYTWANSVSNRAAAIKILKGWAAILVDALNEAKSTDGSQSSESTAEADG